MVEPWRMALVAFLPEPLTRQSFFGGRLSQRSWTYTNACKWKLIRRFTSSHSTGFGRERKNTSRMHSPWVYVAWPLPDHFHRHPDQMKPMDCSLASVAADTTLTSSTPTANPWEKKNAKRNSSLHQVTAFFIDRFFNKRNIVVCNNFAEVNDQLFDGPSIHFSNLWNQRLQKFAPRLIRFHTGVDFHLKRHVQQQIAMAPATLWIYKSYESDVESCGKYVYYSGVVISSAPVLKCVSMFTGWMQHALLSMRRNCFSSQACRLWVPSRLWQLPSPWLWASWDEKKTTGPGFHTNRGERVYDLPPDKLSITNIETSHQKWYPDFTRQRDAPLRMCSSPPLQPCCAPQSGNNVSSLAQPLCS